MTGTYLYFYNSLANHRYFDSHTNNYMHIEDKLWRMYSFSNSVNGIGGVTYLLPTERDRENDGSILFSQIVMKEAARVRSYWNGTLRLQ